MASLSIAFRLVVKCRSIVGGGYGQGIQARLTSHSFIYRSYYLLSRGGRYRKRVVGGCVVLGALHRRYLGPETPGYMKRGGGREPGRAVGCNNPSRSASGENEWKYAKLEGYHDSD